MKKYGLFVSCMLLASCTYGCGTPLDKATDMAYTGGLALGSAAQKLQPEVARKIVPILQQLKPALSQLASTDDFVASVFPVVKPEIDKLFDTETEREVAYALIKGALVLTERIVDRYPEFRQHKEYWFKIVVGALDGTIRGILSVEVSIMLEELKNKELS